MHPTRPHESNYASGSGWRANSYPHAVKSFSAVCESIDRIRFFDMSAKYVGDWQSSALTANKTPATPRPARATN